LEDVCAFLDIKSRKTFYSHFRSKYKDNIDYVTEYVGGKSVKGKQQMKYYITLDTFEMICMSTHSKKGDSARSYFIELRKFIDYYKQNISDMILEKIQSNEYGYMYIILVNKNKNIFKPGRSNSEDLRKRLKQYATGQEKHPDVKFIMLVNDQLLVENCCKLFLKKYQYRGSTELYKVDIDIIRKAIFDCASTDKNLVDLETEINKNNNVDAYVVFDNSTIKKSKSKTKSKSKPKTKTKSKSKPKTKSKTKSKSNRTTNKIKMKGGTLNNYSQFFDFYMNNKYKYTQIHSIVI